MGDGGEPGAGAEKVSSLGMEAKARCNEVSEKCRVVYK